MVLFFSKKKVVSGEVHFPKYKKINLFIIGLVKVLSLGLVN